jgi:hypothetical protein
MNMKKMLILLAVALACGCTGPKYRFAEYSLRTGINNDDRVINDFANLVKQGSLDTAGHEVSAAVKGQDAAAAKGSVLKLVNIWDKVFALQIAHERNRQLEMIGLQFVWEQQGFLNLLAQDWRDASLKAEEENQATTQPAAK